MENRRLKVYVNTPYVNSTTTKNKSHLVILFETFFNVTLYTLLNFNCFRDINQRSQNNISWFSKKDYSVVKYGFDQVRIQGVIQRAGYHLPFFDFWDFKPFISKLIYIKWWISNRQGDGSWPRTYFRKFAPQLDI